MHEKRSSKVTYPPARSVNRNTSTLAIRPSQSGFTDAYRVEKQLKVSLKQKLQAIDGPQVSVARGDEVSLALAVENFQFVNAYKLREGVKRVDESFNIGCDCGTSCDPATCQCLTREENSGPTIIPYMAVGNDDEKTSVLRPEFLKRTEMIFECSARCSCQRKCWNCVVQRGRTIRLEIFNTGNRGFGELPA